MHFSCLPNLPYSQANRDVENAQSEQAKNGYKNKEGRLQGILLGQGDMRTGLTRARRARLMIRSVRETGTRGGKASSIRHRRIRHGRLAPSEWILWLKV